MTSGMDRKTAGLDFARSTHSAAWPNGRGQTATYDSTFGAETTRVGGESAIAFDLPVPPPNAAVSVPAPASISNSSPPRRSLRSSAGGINRGFSNRLTLDEIEGETYEMDEKTGSSTSSGGSDGGKAADLTIGPESPVLPITPSTIGSRTDADDAVNSNSTTHLNVLPKVGRGF